MNFVMIAFVFGLGSKVLASQVGGQTNLMLPPSENNKPLGEGADSKKEVGSAFATFAFVTLPKPTGPYLVATKSIHVEDPSRKQSHGEEKRSWMIQAYFPTYQPTKISPFRVRGTFPYAPTLLQAGSLKGVFVEAYASPYQGTLKDQNGGYIQMPVMIIAPSLSYGRFDYTILAEELASCGCVVLVTEIPFVTSMSVFNDIHPILPSGFDLWNFSRNSHFKQDFTNKVMADYQKDINWIINNLDQLSQYLQFTVDRQRVVLMGHAEGVPASRNAGLYDDRIAAYIEYYPQTDLVLKTKLTEEPCAKPVLTMIAKDDEIGQERTSFFDFVHFDFHKPQAKIFEKTMLVNQEVWRAQAQKNAITDYGYLGVKVPVINENKPLNDFFNWLFNLNPLIENRYIGVSAKDPEVWVKSYRQKIVEWLAGLHIL